MTEAEAYDIMIKCVEEIQRRLIINLPNFHIQIVDKNGIRVLPDITTATVLSKKSQA